MHEPAPPPQVAWTAVQDGALVQLLNRLRVLAVVDDLRIFAVPADSSTREQVHVLVTRNDTHGMYFPTIGHYALEPMIRPEVQALHTKDGVTTFDLSFDDSRGRRKTTQVEIHSESFDIWGVRFEDLTGQPHILESLEDRTPPCDDDEDLEEDAPPADALVVRLFDLPQQAFVRWMGGMYRYIPVLHLAVAHGEGEGRVERVFRLPPMDMVEVHALRRRADGSFMLVLALRPFDADNPFLSKLPGQTSTIEIHPGGRLVIPG